MKAYQFLILLTSVLIISISGCSSENASIPVSEGTKNQILHRGNGAEPQDLDPHIVTGVPEHNIISALLEGLVSPNPGDLSHEPGTAEAWTVSEDMLTYTFTIRKDAKWSNGIPVTAEDFVYSWKRILSPALGSEYAYMLYYIKNAAEFHRGEIRDFAGVGVKAAGPSTLIVNLARPTPFFLSVLTHFSTFPVHRQTIEKFGAADARGTKWTRPGNYVGNGPFILKEWGLNRKIVVERNPLYWDAEKVRLKEIHFYPVENLSTEERMFRAGQLHITNKIPSEKIAVYKDKYPEKMRITPYLGTYYYMFNTGRKPFDNVNVRLAFAMSIDRRIIVDKITKGGEMPAFSFTPPDTAGYTSEAAVPFDIGKAKSLLAQAGYPDGKGFPPVEIIYNTSEGHRKIAVAIQQMWKQALNVDVTIVNMDWKVYLSRRTTGDFDIARAGWIGDYVDPNTFLDMFISGSGNNHTGWRSDKYDELILRAGQTTDRKNRYAFFQAAEKILLDNAPVIPIYTYTNSSLISPDVKGWHANILDHHPYKAVYLSSRQ